MSEEYKRWEARYSAPDYIFGKEPNYFLAKCKPLLPASGRVLAVADGEGRNSVWLAEQGLDVHAIDFSPTAQDKARALARERGVNVIFELADVHNWSYPEAAYEVVCEIFTQFSTPAERALKWAGMRKALKSGALSSSRVTPRSSSALGQGDRSSSTNSTQSPCWKRHSPASRIWSSQKKSWRCMKARRMAACRR